MTGEKEDRTEQDRREEWSGVKRREDKYTVLTSIAHLTKEKEVGGEGGGGHDQSTQKKRIPSPHTRDHITQRLHKATTIFCKNIEEKIRKKRVRSVKKAQSVRTEKREHWNFTQRKNTRVQEFSTR